jgi:hypothetical protein
MIVPFLRQRHPAYRNFQFAYTVLTLNFLIPATSYLVAPDMMVQSVHDLGALLTDAPYTACEDSHMWRFLAVSDVLTLGFMCLLLQLNLRRWYPVLLPLLFCKGSSVVASAYVGLFQYPHAFFICPVVLDSVTCLAIWFFASRARKVIGDGPDGDLVPHPRFSDGGAS